MLMIFAVKFKQLENTLTADVHTLSSSCQNWRLKLSLTKLVTCVFHFHHASASRVGLLNVSLNGHRLKHSNQCTLAFYWIWSCYTELTSLKLRHKLTSRSNLISKLAGSTRAAKADTLRTSLALCYSVAEYCLPSMVQIQSHKHDWLSVTQYHVTYFRMCWQTFHHQTCVRS